MIIIMYLSVVIVDYFCIQQYKKYLSKKCDNYKNFKKINIPYLCKLLFRDLNMIAPRPF